jgi:putative transposase
MTSQPIQLGLPGIGLSFSMPESRQQSKRKICSVNANISYPNILKENLSKKLEEDSTTNGKKCLPYWNGSCQEMSNLLWSHTKIGSQDLASICSNGSAPNTLVKSWFSTKLNYLPNEKWLKTSCQSSIVSQPDCMDSESIHLKSQKIRIYPEKSLHLIWKQWLAASRYCFNQAVAYQRQHGFISKYDLRKVILKNDLPDWIKESPYHLKVNAIYDSHAAFKASRKSGIKQQEAGRFRSIRDRIQSIKFRVEDFKKGTWLPSVTKELNFQASEPIPTINVEYQQKQKGGTYKTCIRKQSWNAETQLVYDKKRWFAVFPTEFKPQTSNSQSLIALDPGVRSFLTGFDGKSFIDIGNKDITRIYRFAQHIDKLISSKITFKGRRNKHKRQRLQKKIESLFIRIRNLIDEVHKKVAKWLTTEYRVIFLPTFESSQMVAKSGKKKRKLNSKTVRQMLNWAHYRFKQTLKFHALKRGATVIDVTEEYTSKTCTKCGRVHQNLGGSKHFKCPHCGHSMPRDWNSALGIFLKALRDAASVDGSAVTLL